MIARPRAAPLTFGRAGGRSRMLITPVRVSKRLVGSPFMGMVLTKRRAVDLCRVATCLCRPVI
jgi:hypothetical protein